MSKKRKNIIIMSSINTKWEAVQFLKEYIAKCGHNPIVLDISMMKNPNVTLEPDIKAIEVAEAGGGGKADTEGETGKRAERVEIFKRGAIKIVKEMVEDGRADGFVAIGGATNTGIASAISKALPFGFPKLILSSVAAMRYDYIDRSDVALFASIVDTDSLNIFLRNSLARAAYMICGAVDSVDRPVSAEIDELRKSGVKVIAMTQLWTSDCCAYILDILRRKGNYEVITYHSVGIGDMIMENQIEAGMKFDAVIDTSIMSLSGYLLGGNIAADKTRLEAAGKKGIPQIITPAGLDLISCGPISRRDSGHDPLWEKKGFKQRKLFSEGDVRIQVKISPEEAILIGRTVAKKLNQAKGPVKFLVPWKGWSIANMEGQPLYEPETDKLLIDTIKAEVNPEITEIREYDLYINTPEFASVIVETLEEMLSKTA
ncbi:MAG: Tm-1-like ATP-binding domain-containing protein [Deltaproteobacteria bacterium]|nr:Tm-1-like ATP-binding domain-containing protein [Deltaproteobacteria bacterium]MBW2044421.1 Tm-1-like ATP-binding domain-containing protein [Deltaproteobacteria bacterium]